MTDNYEPPQIIVVGANEDGEPLINSMRVTAILIDCLYDDKELLNGLPETAVMAEGILNNFAFHPGRLESHREEVEKMLCNLPLAFRPAEVGGSGGWSFLNLCQDANDMQWTGEHRTMEMLCCLGIALGVAAWALPRDMWMVFPGGMPYLMVMV